MNKKYILLIFSFLQYCAVTSFPSMDVKKGEHSLLDLTAFAKSKPILKFQ